MDQKLVPKIYGYLFFTEVENRDLLTRFGCTLIPTWAPQWELLAKHPFFAVGMKMGYNPQENPQIYLVISTHLKNLLIKLQQFFKNSWGKKQKNETNHHLDFRCFLLFQTSMGGDLFRHDKLFWTRPKMPPVCGVSVSVF